MWIAIYGSSKCILLLKCRKLRQRLNEDVFVENMDY